MDVDVESQKTPKPHDFLWFPDGSVVLATDLYLFKVHKSLLSLHSSVFKDMFEPPNMDESVAEGIGAGEAQEMYDGLPLVTLIGMSFTCCVLSSSRGAFYDPSVYK